MRIEYRQVFVCLHLHLGQTITYEVVGRDLVMKPIEEPFELAIKSRKWAKTSVAQFEAESVRDQDEFSG